MNSIMNNTRITALVESVDENNGLYIRILDTDEEGYIPAHEIARDSVRVNPYRLQGDLLQVSALEGTYEDLPMYSAKTVQEENYAEVCTAFEENRRNTYIGTFKGLDQNRKLAFYELEPGVVGAVHISNFCLTRVPDYTNIKLPVNLPVAILAIENGKINLSSVMAFGSFNENIKKLNLEQGSVVEGTCVDELTHNKGFVVCLAPNVFTIVTWCPGVGKIVSLRINGIDDEHNRIKAVFARAAREGGLFDTEPFVCCPERESAMVDVEAFTEANRVKKVEKPVVRAAEEEDAPETAEEKVGNDLLQPSFNIDATESPLRLFENEVVTIGNENAPMPLHYGLIGHKLNKRHKDLAEAVDTLKFTSAYLLERYLFVTGLPMETKSIKRGLETLCKFGVLTRFRFTTGEKQSIYYVYTRGPAYKAFMGRYFSFQLGSIVDGDSASPVKGRVAVNQLLIGLRHNYTVKGQAPYKFPDAAADPGSLYCCYRLETEELGSLVLESCRRDYDEQLVKKLLRYDARFLALGQYPGVAVTFEDEAHLEAFAERIKDFDLSYTLYLTHDTKCFQRDFVKVIVPTYAGKVRKSGGNASLWTKLKGMTGLLSGLFS